MDASHSRFMVVGVGIGAGVGAVNNRFICVLSVVEAKDVTPSDRNGLSDSYCKLKVTLGLGLVLS